ncbi:MAG: diguanylate cyclase [Cloacibacillus sp.]
MSRTNFSRTAAYNITAVVFCILLAGIFVWYQHSLNAALKEAAASDLKLYAQSSSNEIKYRLTRIQDNLSIIADLAANYKDLHSKELMTILAKYSAQMPFAYLTVALPNGDALTSTGKRVDVEGRNYFHLAMAGTPNIAGPLKSRISFKDVILFATPIKRNGAVIGVLYATFTHKGFQRAFNITMQEEKGYLYIVDERGRVLLAPTGKKAGTFISARNMLTLEVLAQVRKADPDGKNIAEEFLQNDSGYMMYSFAGEQRILYYAKLGVSDWHLVTVMPVPVLFDRLSAFINIAFHFGMLIILLFCAGGIAIFYLLRGQIRETNSAKERLKTLTSNIPGGVSCCLPTAPYEITEISDGYLDLLQCPRDKFPELYKNCFIETVHPDDRDAVMREIAEQAASGDTMSLEYRVVTAGGGTKWVIDKGRPGTDTLGRDCFYCVVLDNTQAKIYADSLALSEERYRVVTETADECLFDWNVLTDDVYFSQSYEKRFGQSRIYRLIHSDDMQIYTDFVNTLLSGAPGMHSAQLRLKDKNGLYIWNSAQAAAITDASGVVRRIVGILKDINAQVQEHEKLLMRAQCDGLTNLYDKGATNSLIAEFLDGTPRDAKHAVFICDVDNFKIANDTYGHFFGDTVLVDIAKSLRAIFRSSDIVGRIGGDEFMILMKNIPDDKLIALKGLEILDAFRQKYDGFTTSGSVGVAVFAEDGTTLEELYRNADAALYKAKSAGKNRFVRFCAEPQEQSE